MKTTHRPVALPFPSTRLLAALACAACGFWSLSNSAHAQIPQLIHYEGRIAVGNTNFDGTGQFKFALVDGGANPAATATAVATVVSGFVVGIQVTNPGSGYTAAPAVTILDPFGSGAAATATIAGGSVTGITVTSAGIGYSPFPTVVVGSPVLYTSYWSNDGTSVAGNAPAAFVTLPVLKGLYSLNLGDTALPNMGPIPAAVFTNPDVRLRIWFNDGVRGFQQLSPDQRIAAVGYAMIADGVKDGAITSAKIAPGAIQGINIANGAIGSNQLAVGGIQMSNIATGAIGSAQLAPGAVGFATLAKPPQSGTVEGGVLAAYSGNGPFTVTFPQAYTQPPVVTASPLTISAPGASVQITATIPSGFSGSVSGFQPTSRTLDGPANVGQFSSVSQLDGVPGISYANTTNGVVKFVRSLDTQGQSWGSPVTVAPSTVSTPTSLEVVTGNPAIAFAQNSGPSKPQDVMFVRATSPDGDNWGSPVTVGTTSVNVSTAPVSTSMLVVSGVPVIAYCGSTAAGLQFTRAVDASGSNWNGPTTLDASAIASVANQISMAIVNNAPALSYYDPLIAFRQDLKYVRAADPSGITWSAPVLVDSFGAVGQFSSLAVVSGNPAISYYDATNTDLKFVRALDANGSVWGSPVTLDSFGNVGQYTALIVVDGRPTILYYDATTTDLKFVRALDAAGTSWMAPVALNTTGSIGTFISAVPLLDEPAVSFYDATNADLKFLRLPKVPALKINWISLPP